MTVAYATEEEAQDYFDGRLNTDAWDDTSASGGDRAKALLTASRAIDRLNFISQQTDEDQDNQFPRGGAEEIPDNIVIACCEETLSLLEGRDPVMEEESLRIVSQTYANVKSAFDPSVAAEHIFNGITSPIAWRYIKPYIRNTTSPEIERV